MFLNLLLSTALLGRSFAIASYGPSVQLGKTTVIGSDMKPSGQEFFGGLPFAETPVGNLRFKPPVLKGTLGTDVFNATNFGAACLQIPTLPFNGPQAEDCLTINVWRPAGTSSSSKLPVMAWIYGGGFFSGTGALYNGSSLVEESVKRGTPIIYVNFNYRLGPLGFPQGNEAKQRGALNLGLKDQLTALEWIQHNIAAFGGDKTKVTIFGESAGAISIGIHYLNKNLENLARAAVFESGSASSGTIFEPSHHQTDWRNFVAAVPECQSLASTPNTFTCMRNASSDAILNAFGVSLSLSSQQLPWVPTLDGEGGLIPDLPSKLWEQGQFANIPFIAGTNLDEGTFFTSDSVNSSSTIREWIIANYSSPRDVPSLNATASQLLQLYPDNPALGSPFNTGNETFGLSPEYKRLAAINGDILFHSLRRLWIQQATTHNVKTFGYLFTDTPPSGFVPPSKGVMHITEVLYLYPDLIPGLELSPAAQDLGAKMMDYWISFATSLNPNDGKGNNRPKWAQYSSRNKELLQLNSMNTTLIPDNYRSEQIGFINSHSETFRH